MKNHNHDLIHQLSEVADSLWRFDEFIKNAQGCEHCVNLWNQLKGVYAGLEKELISEIKRHMDEGRFE